MKYIYITIGSLSVALGVLGIFLPILPTTPFLLLAAACYAKSSEKMYNYLMNNNFLGVYIRNYREKRGMTFKTKLTIIILLWVSIVYSISNLPDYHWLKALLVTIAASVSYHLIVLKTIRNAEDGTNKQKRSE